MTREMLDSTTITPVLDTAIQRVRELILDCKEPGLLGSAVFHALYPAGKLARPRLLLAASNAVGGNAHASVPAAFAVETLHVGSLVHDDIMDNDSQRRGRDSVFGAFGMDIALVAGDSLMFRSFDWAETCLASGISVERILRAFTVLAQTGHELCRGQVLEEEIAREQRLDIASYMSVVRGKTAALFRASAQVGAILGGGDSTEEARWAAVGMKFGTLFQMQDDLLPYRQKGMLAGKDPLSDVRNGRVTLPWIVAVQGASDPERAELLNAQRLAAVLGNQPDDMSRIVEIVGRERNIESCEIFINSLTREVESLLESLIECEGTQVARQMLSSSSRRWK